MTMVRLPHAEIMTTWRPISHSDILHIQQELAKVHSSVSTGIQGTRRTVEEILEDATHSRRRLLTHLLQRCLSPPKGITILQLIPRPGLQLTATSWPRQLSTPLPSLLCLTMAPTLPTLRLTNLRMLMVSVILNFKTWTDCVLFGQYFLENTYVVFFLYAQHFLPVHIIIIFSRTDLTYQTMLIFIFTPWGHFRGNLNFTWRQSGLRRNSEESRSRESRE